MTSQANVHRAVVAALNASGPLKTKLGTGTRIYDTPPSNAPFPYISMGEVVATPHDTKDDPGQHHLFQINVWANSGGRGWIKEVQDIIDPLFHRATLTVGGQPAHSYVVSHRTLQDPSPDPTKVGLMHGVTQIRITT